MNFASTSFCMGPSDHSVINMEAGKTHAPVARRLRSSSSKATGIAEG